MDGRCRRLYELQYAEQVEAFLDYALQSAEADLARTGDLDAHSAR